MRLKGKKPIFNYKDTWSLDLVLAPVICEGLKKYIEVIRDNDYAGIPGGWSEEEDTDHEEAFARWLALLETMSLAFDLKYISSLENEALKYFSKAKEMYTEPTGRKGYTEVKFKDIGSSLDRRNYEEATRLEYAEHDAMTEARIEFGKYFRSLWW